MLSLWAFRLVWLICSLVNVCEFATGADAASKKDCYRKTCMSTEYDTREAVCCENQLHQGAEAELSCCGQEVFNPAVATCCKVKHENTTTVNITQGISKMVSDCCGLKAFNSLNEICCQSTIIVRPVPNAQCCGKVAFDEEKQLCCGPNETVLTRKSPDEQCCGHEVYNTKTECCYEADDVLKKASICSQWCSKKSEKQPCCGPNETVLIRKSPDEQCCGHELYNTKTECCFQEGDVLKKEPICSQRCSKESVNITQGISKTVSDFCGLKAFNSLNEICCQSIIIVRPVPNAQCCGKVAFDEEERPCCGPNETVLIRKSPDEQCCGHELYNTKTECCYEADDVLKKASICSQRCSKELGAQQQKPSSQPNCTKPQTHLCGSSCYNPNEFRCCERNQTEPHWCCAGQCDAVPTVYNPRTHVCCDGCVSDGKPWIDQFHGLPGLEQHCCGREVYRPDTEICCDGHREKIHLKCCGIKAYDIKDPQMKCCAGRLYNLTSIGEQGHDEQCCGSILHNSSSVKSVCCSSEDNEVLYSIKTGFRCCGHLYYNSTLWSCFAGKLSPVSQLCAESRLLSLNNLNETDLCKEMYIGTVESVSLVTVVFRNVLKIHGRNGTVKPLAFPHFLKIPDHYNSTKLIPGKTYFFHDSTKLIPGKTYVFHNVNFFADFKHHSDLQSLDFIFSKCYEQ
ncbi:uncharacterized protein si:ch211-195m9.3 isoform X2 [Thunnus thynnus]|uniref:uncharacterized protein si:ch211-195m9.3 isoform X2 n=1 Tax=Thunnus thynnus TaxID=8237 RepID=UPI003528A16A